MRDNSRCDACGAALRPEQRWCSQCLAPRATRSDVPAVADVRSAPVPPPSAIRAQQPRLLARYSRWQGGTLAYGPLGRIAATLLAFVPVYWAIFHAGLFGLAFMFMWIFMAIPLILRDVWKRQRVAPGERLASRPTSRTIGL